MPFRSKDLGVKIMLINILHMNIDDLPIHHFYPLKTPNCCFITDADHFLQHDIDNPHNFALFIVVK
jgi:hypothetical protein